MSGCVQSALKHFITKKIKSLQCNGDDGKRRTSATVKCISQNSYPFRNLNFHKMGLGIRGLGPSFLPRSAGDLQRGISFPVLALCDPPLAPHSRSHPAANANSIPPSFWTEELELFFLVHSPQQGQSHNNLPEIILPLWVGTLFLPVKFQFSQYLSSKKKRKKKKFFFWFHLHLIHSKAKKLHQILFMHMLSCSKGNYLWVWLLFVFWFLFFLKTKLNSDARITWIGVYPRFSAN